MYNWSTQRIKRCLYSGIFSTSTCSIQLNRLQAAAHQHAVYGLNHLQGAAHQHAVYRIPAWSPWLVSDIEVLERVQIRAVNMIVGLRSKTYEDKLIELGLTTLEIRRKRYDLVQTFKILNGFDKVNPSIWFRTVDNQHTRLTRNTSYNKNLIATRFKTDIRRNFFSVRVVSFWNSLPIEVKESRNVTIFKTKLEELVI